MPVSRILGRWLVTPGTMLLAAACLSSAGGARGSEFSDRLAAWQGGPPRGQVVPAAAPQAVAPEEPAADRAAPPALQTGPQPAPRTVPRSAPLSQRQMVASGGSDYGPPGGIVDSGMGGYPGGFGPTGGAMGCSTCGDVGPQGCEMCCGKPLWWARFEVLLWWRQGSDLPPLVTSDPISEDSTTAGILPDATILLGDGRQQSDMRVGGRLDIGFWLDDRQCCGIGERYFGLGSDDRHFRTDSLENPVLAIPFFDVTGGATEALLVAFPGLSSGSIDVQNSSSVVGNDLYARFLLCRDCDSRLDFITGWHFSRINDDLRIRSRSEVTEVAGNIPLGTTTNVLDNFETSNRFHGAILGLMHEYECRCWSWQTMARVALGNMNQQVRINGQTTIAVPDEDPEVTAGGLFTNADTNIGSFSRNEFAAVTEVGITLNYHVGPCTKLSVGYSFLYWSNVLRAADQIDTNVGDDRPQFRFDRGDFWVQGLNLGLVRQF